MRYCIFLLFSLSMFAQEAGNLMHDDLLRDYIIYVPESYSSDESIPLVLNLHGYGSNATQQMIYSGLNAVADVNGFIVVCPNGTLDSVESQYWNAEWDDAGVDDVSFLSALIDHLAESYNLDLDRVYSTGMSNGGFMSYTLACSLGDRIAAIASVTGTMTRGQLDTCNPERPVPLMEIHGTVDPTVPYEGDENFMAGIDEVIEYWTEVNSCTTEPVLELLPDLNTEDGSTVEHYTYTCDLAPVELYKVIGGAHTWPGAAFVFSGTNLDFSASEKIWEFFAQHSLSDSTVVLPSGINEPISISTEISISPNPTKGYLIVDVFDNEIDSYEVYNASGQMVYHASGLNHHSVHIDTKSWDTGMYFLRLMSSDNLTVSNELQKIVKVK